MKYIKDYLGKSVAIHCPTKEDAEKICKLLNVVGKVSYPSYWETYKERTAFCTDNNGSFCNVEWYKEQGYTIFEASEFLNEYAYDIY